MAISLEPGTSRGPSKDKDVAVIITSAKFIADHVRGNSNPSVAGVVTFHTDDGEEFVQNYQVGSPEYFAVKSDGAELTSAKPDERPDNKLHISPRAEFSHLMNSLIKLGIPVAKLGTSIKNIVGFKGTVRSFAIDSYTREVDGKSVTRDVLCCLFTKVDPASLGGAASAGAATPVAPGAASAVASSTAAPSPAPAAANGKASDYAKVVLEAVVAAGGTFKVGDGAKNLKYQALKTFVKTKVPATSRKEVTELLISPDFVNGLEGFVYDAEAGEITRA